jgi:putative nucleotidyltransferase with HDIG domain
LLLAAVEHFSSALHWRDTYTQRHCEQVSRIAEALAQALGLDPHRVELTRLAGKLHDIGKIGIRDDILLKTGSLSEDEREAIRQHPMVAFDMLRHIEGAEQIATIVLAHHERPDGKGYPKGLSGAEIPFEAQIVAVADVFSALIEDRSYHQGMALDRVIHLMTGMKGTQLNVDIVMALFRLLRSHGFKEYVCAGK